MNIPLGGLITEQSNARTQRIDELPTDEILRLINEEDCLVPQAVANLIPQLARVVDRLVESFRRGGRLFYVGAGTSGRIGILDASECPPTYGTPPYMVQGIIAGGFQAIVNPVEGAEDNEGLGAAELDKRGLSADDVVVGIAASGRTPFVIGAMKRAKQLGAFVVCVSNNSGSAMGAVADIALEAVVGPEVVLGSTRMKAGTAQKLILNMLTTASMIRLGKVYGNLMVDLQPSNVKLVDRAKRIIRMATGAEDAAIETVYEASGGHVKTAIVMLLTGSDAAAARDALQQAEGYVRGAIGLLNAPAVKAPQVD